MDTKSYNIGVFDDHPIITSGIQNILKEDPALNLVLIANEKAALLEQLATQLVDILILDVVTPDVSGLELFEEIHQKYPEIYIVAYTTLTSTILIENILLAGARAYINKRQSAQEVLEALRRVGANQMYLPAQYQFLLKTSRKNTIAIQLSKREKEVLRLILDGKLTKEIASILSISKNTVENHRAKLFKKLKVSNLAELIKQATQMGYVDI